MSNGRWERKPPGFISLDALANPCEPLAIRDKRVLDDLLNRLWTHWVFGRQDVDKIRQAERDNLLEAGDDFNDPGDSGAHAAVGGEAFESMEIEGFHFDAAATASAASAASASSATVASAASAHNPAIEVTNNVAVDVGPRVIPKTFKEIQEYAWEMFDMTHDRDNADLSYGKIERQYMVKVYPVLRLWLEFVSNDYVGEKTEKTLDNMKRITRVLEVITTIKDILENSLRLLAAAYPEKGINIPDQANMFKFSGIDYTKNNAYQNFLLELLKILHRKGYKRYRGGVAEQIRTDDHLTEDERQANPGYATMTMRPVMTIPKFVYGCLKKETNYQLWSNATVSHSNIKMAIQHLQMGDEIEFPEADVDRHIFNFMNGEVDIKEGTFLPWEDIYKRGHTRAASKFFKEVFKPEWMTEKFRDNWADIPTPNFERPFIHQKFTEGYMEMVYILGGRTLFWVNDFDGWGVVPFGRGVAGTGKSLWGRVNKTFYPPEYVAVLSSNMEKKFGLSQTDDKFQWINYEMSVSSEMDQMDFQSMVSGEEVSIGKKYADPKTVEFKVPGMLFGNMVNRRWIDTSGQLKRRIFPFEFNFKVSPDEVDTNLYKTVTGSEMAPLLAKYFWAYRVAAMDRPGDIWQWCPQECRDAATRLHAHNNSITAFLETDIMEQGPERYISFERFNALFMDFCKKRTLRPIILNEESIRPICEDNGFVVEKGVKYQEGRMLRGTWIMGVGVSEAHEDDARSRSYQTPSTDRLNNQNGNSGVQSATTSAGSATSASTNTNGFAINTPHTTGATPSGAAPSVSGKKRRHEGHVSREGVPSPTATSTSVFPSPQELFNQNAPRATHGKKRKESALAHASTDPSVTHDEFDMGDVTPTGVEGEEPGSATAPVSAHGVKRRALAGRVVM